MTVTSGAEWRRMRTEGIEIKFPSGAVFALRPIEVDFFLMNNDIPDDIAPAVMTLISGDSASFNIPTAEQLIRAREQWIPFLNRLATFAMVNPKVVADPQADDEISVDDLSYNDKLFIYAFFAQPARKMRSFHDAQNSPLAIVDPESGVFPAPQRVAKRRRVGK